MFKQWSTFHFLQIPLSIIYLLFIVIWAIKDNFLYRDYIVPFSCILLPCLWFFLIKRGLKLRRSERAALVAFLKNSGFYEISKIDAMNRNELYLRCKLQFKYPNQDFSSLTMFQLRLKSLTAIAGDVGAVVGTAKGISDSFKEGGRKINNEQVNNEQVRLDALKPPTFAEYTQMNSENNIELKKSIHLIWLLPLWFIQYSILYAVFSFKIMTGILKFALNIGVIGLILLCVPVVGWIILAFWMLNRPNSPSYPVTGSRFRPWFINVLKK